VLHLGLCQSLSDCSLCSVHLERCSAPDPGEGTGDAQDCGNAKLPGHNGGVRKHPAGFRDHSGGHPEQRCPGRISRAADQDVAGPHSGELVDAVNGACSPAGGTRAGSRSSEKVIGGTSIFGSGLVSCSASTSVRHVSFGPGGEPVQSLLGRLGRPEAKALGDLRPRQPLRPRQEQERGFEAIQLGPRG